MGGRESGGVMEKDLQGGGELEEAGRTSSAESSGGGGALTGWEQGKGVYLPHSGGAS